MSNLLRNPTLSGFTLGRYFTEKNGSVGTIEYPLEWEFVAAVREMEDPEKLPQSLHRDQGFAISAGYRSWEGGFVQRNVPLAGGTRYLAKVGFVPHVGFADGRVDLSAVTWRIQIETPLGTVGQDWQMTQKGAFDQYEELYFVFDCAQGTEATFHFEGRSPWAGNMCELQVFACSLEAIANDGSPAPVIGQSMPHTTAPAAPAPDIMREPAPPHVGPMETNPPAPIGQPTPIGQRPEDAAAQGARGTMALSSDPYEQINAIVAGPDLPMIVATLRSARTPDGQTVEALLRLADALEALKR